MVIRPVKSIDDYNNALLRIDELIDAKPGTKAGIELDILATLVEVFEGNHFPIESPNEPDA